MRQRTRLKLAAGLLAVLIVLLCAVIVVAVMKRGRQRQTLVSDLVAQSEAAEPVVADPWARRETDAVLAVQRMVTPAGGLTVRQRIDQGLLGQTMPWLTSMQLPEAEWYARRIADTSVYEVRYRFTWHAVQFGPRWMVQLDPQGLRPESAVDGVLAVNAMASLVHTADTAPLVRYFDRSDEVLKALTEHRFVSGLRLPSSLLIFFAGREAMALENVFGWLVVPELIDPNGELNYRVYFQWREGERLEDAIWQVSYQDNQPSFRPRDRRAEDIMAQGGSLSAESIIDIRPMTMRDEVNPAAEREDCRRALRYLLSDGRVVEGVGTLLSFRAQNAAVEYRTWRVDYSAATRDRCVVEYLYNEDGSERSVSWEVAHADGRRYPTSELSRLTELAVSTRVLELPPVP